MIEHLLSGDKRTVIASELGISVRQVTRHLDHVRVKIAARSTLHLAVLFARSPVHF